MYKRYIKRVLDILFSGLALIVFSPILVVVAILVRVKLGAPVLFKQQRPGMKDPKTNKERLFWIFKFRTMSNQTDENGNLLPDTVRLTRFGCFLRSTSLDELPELINIFKGDMSIVGPRPLATIYLPYYTQREHHRHDVRPGLTGWAQVNGRNSLSWDNKFKYDLEYIEKLSFLFDARIVLLTVKKVFIREGIGQGEEHPGSLHELRKDWLDENGNMKPEYQEI